MPESNPTEEYTGEKKIQIEGNCDFIIHAAAVTTSKLMVSQPVDNIKTAVNGTDKMLKFAVDKNAHRLFIFLRWKFMDSHLQKERQQNRI